MSFVRIESNKKNESKKDASSPDGQLIILIQKFINLPQFLELRFGGPVRREINKSKKFLGITKTMERRFFGTGNILDVFLLDF